MSRRRRSRVTGDRRLRRVLRRIEPEVRQHVKTPMEDAAQAIWADLVILTPEGPRGNLRRLLDWRVTKDGLSARIGLLTKRTRSDGFYFRFLDQGTKGYAPKNIPPLAARHIRARAFDANKDWAIERVKGGISLALRRASVGGGSRDE